MKTLSKVSLISDFLLRNRIRLTFFIFTLCILKDIHTKVRPNDICNIQNFFGFWGLILVLFGVALRSWAAGIIHKNRSLATNGPYSLTRHPLYIGSFLMACGFCAIIGNSKNILVVLVIALLFYLPKIRKEEYKLAQKFSEDWKKYLQQTYLVFPKTFLQNVNSSWSLAQWKKNKEYRAFISAIIALFMLKIIHEYSHW